MGRFIGLCLAGIVGFAATGEAVDFESVRSDDPATRALVARGHERSATFRALVDRIERFHGIVYVQRRVKLSRGMDAALLQTTTAPLFRVALRAGLAGDYAIAILAHELQHVVEALEGKSGGDADLASGDGMFETLEARAVAARVRDELRAARM